MAALPWIVRELTPPPPRIAPNGMTAETTRILAGLPHSIVLAEDMRLIVTLATGDAVLWRDADATAVVTTSDEERTPPNASDESRSRRVPAALVVQRGRRVLATLPLALAAHRVTDPAGGFALELVTLGWKIRAGSLRGGGDFGSFVSLAWKRVDGGASRFEPPPIHPRVAARQRPTIGPVPTHPGTVAVPGTGG
jgi:hypothetical protein